MSSIPIARCSPASASIMSITWARTASRSGARRTASFAPGRPQVILDVAHNSQAAQVLADNLANSGFAPETIAVCGMLRDKDIGGVLRTLAPRITRWHMASLSGPRAASAEDLAQHVKGAEC